MTLEGQVKEDEMVYLIEKSRGPFIIEREGMLDVVGNMLVGLMDKFVDPDFSKTLKKFRKEGEEKYL